MTSADLESLRKLIEKLDTAINVISKDQKQLIEDPNFIDLEKQKESSAFKIELEKKEI